VYRPVRRRRYKHVVTAAVNAAAAAAVAASVRSPGHRSIVVVRRTQDICPPPPGSSPSCWGRGKAPILSQRRGPKGRRLGRKGPRTGWGSWGESIPPLHTSYGVCGSAVICLSGVLGKAPVAKMFSCTLEAPDCLCWNLLGTENSVPGRLKFSEIHRF